MAYIADGNAGLTVINISEPASPFLADSIETPKSIYDVYASGDYAYLGNGQSGFIVTAMHAPVTAVTVVDSTNDNRNLPGGAAKGFLSCSGYKPRRTTGRGIFIQCIPSAS